MENGTEMAKKARAFVDLSNLNALGDELEIAVDHRALRELLAARFQIVEMRYYVPPLGPVGKGFLNFLSRAGFTVVEYDQENVDPLIIADIETMHDDVEVIVLVSGDRDFAPALTKVRDAGKDVVVASINSKMSSELFDLGEYIDLETHKEEITDRTKTRKRQRKLELQQAAVQANQAKTIAGQLGQLVAGTALVPGAKITISNLVSEISVSLRYPLGVTDSSD